jgi:hypothetical protein
MTIEEIEIIIRPDGKVEYTIRGVKGSGCESISALLEQLGTVETETRTGEYYEQDPDVIVNLAAGH